MGALSNIMFHSAGSMFLGIFITLAGVGLMFFLIKSWRRNATYTLLSFIVGGVLFFFLAFQSILLCGAVTIKSYTDNVETRINELVGSISENTVFTREDSQAILERIRDEWPLVGYYIGGADFHGHTPGTIAKAMADELRSYMNWFILRRVGWCLLFIVAGTFVVIKTMDGTGKNTRKTQKRAPSTYRRIYDD